MNESHLAGELQEMLIGDQIQHSKHEVVILKPKKQKTKKANQHQKEEDL
jgi:hypothetical protein